MKIEPISLELLRPGPPHGQLLSPLTQYLALCEDHGPVTFTFEFEHWELTRQLARLRYYTRGDVREAVASVDNSLRENTLTDLGNLVRQVLRDLVTLPAELGRAAADGELVHLRLILSGNELSLIPFELGIAPLGYPGEGVEMLLQRRVPTIVTREVRRGRPLPMQWNRNPRILFVSAGPEGMSVPVKAHLLALRKALDPYVKRGTSAEEQRDNVKELLTVMTNASLSAIKQACREGEYTHVHILAHGAARGRATEQQFGVLLCDDDHPERGEVVAGRRLAQALQPDLADGTRRCSPSVVSLATCDSGNVGSVVAPTASIAHEMQSFGVPLVFASQFPLTKSGSVDLAFELYSGLLAGTDPRIVLYNLRDMLSVGGVRHHDWASLVAYTSQPPDFHHTVREFRARQIRRAVDVQLGWAQQCLEDEDGTEEANQAIEAARAQLEEWRKGLPSLRADTPVSEKRHVVECYGVTGATEKRAAGLFFAKGDEKRAEQLLQSSAQWYWRAVEVDPTAHWPSVQYLSLSAVLGLERDAALIRSVLRWAERDLEKEDPSDRAWAHGSLAELHMLRLYHDRPRNAQARSDLADEVAHHCVRIGEIMGSGSFHVFSTRRQFDRYLSWWKNARWSAIAGRAVRTLSQ